MATVPLSQDGLLSDALANVPGISVIAVDADVRVRGLVGTALARHGHRVDSVIGRSVAEVVTPEAWARMAPLYARVLAGETFTVELPSGDGTAWYQTTFVPVLQDGAVAGATVTLFDITERHFAEQELAERERQFRLMAESSLEGHCRYAPDGTLLWASPAIATISGYDLDDLVGRPVQQVLHPDDVPRAAAAFQEFVHTRNPITLELRARHADGSWRWIESTVRGIFDDAGALQEIHSTTRDVTERRAAERERNAATVQFEKAFSEAPIGMALVALDGRWLRVNRALTDMLGYDDAALQARTFQDITHPDDLDADLAHLARLLDGEIDHFTMEKRYFTATGALIWVLLSVSLVRDETGAPEHFIAQIVDISERKRIESHLHHLADHDPLTGLWNRRRFEDEVARQVARCQRYGEIAALIYLDIDAFKHVNDSLGHRAGDELIAHVAKSVAERLRESDSVGRLGGDEFAVLLPHVNAAAAQRIATELCERIADTPMRASSGEVRATISAGVALLAPSSSFEQAFIEADVALYRAKDAGRNRAVSHDAAR